MNLRNDTRQTSTQMNLDFHSAPMGEARRAMGEATESFSTRHTPESPASMHQLMEEVCERENLRQALQQVKANKGSPGIDGMTVEELTGYLKQHWPAIREQLLNETYEPKPVRRVEIESRTGEGCANSAFLVCWTGSSSKRCCRFCSDGGTRRFPTTATGSDRDGRPIKRWPRRRSTLPQATAG